MAFGKRNEIKVDILKYNIGLIGESGIGKTTIIKEVLEKLTGCPEGALFAECGKEDGADAINDINYVNCPDWDSEYNEDENSVGFSVLVDDIIENKTTEYPKLRTLVVDTYDQLLEISKREVVRLHNKEFPEKRVKSVKAAFGGYMAGDDMATDIVLEKLWELKKVGVNFIIIGHVKQREQEDVVSGQKYTSLTTNMSLRDFNAIKTKLHFLGVASINRDIVREKTGKKDIKGRDVTKGVIASESRQITFRDDSYSIDSKSRFAEITPVIEFSSDEFIKALENAIKAELSKGNKSFEKLEEEQKAKAELEEKRIAEAEKAAREEKELSEVKSKIVEFFTANKTDMAKIKPVLEMCREAGYNNPNEIDNIETAKKVLNACK